MSLNIMSSPDKTPQEQFYRTLLESFFGAIMCVDARGRVVYANKQMAEMIPVPYEELIHGSIHYAESQGNYPPSLCRRLRLDRFAFFSDFCYSFFIRNQEVP